MQIEQLSHKILQEVWPLLAVVITAILAIVGFFAKKWVDNIENNIKERVTKDICLKEHTNMQQRRISDEARVKLILDELRMAEKKLDDHIQWHLKGGWHLDGKD